MFIKSYPSIASIFALLKSLAHWHIMLSAWNEFFFPSLVFLVGAGAKESKEGFRSVAQRARQAVPAMPWGFLPAGPSGRSQHLS